MDITPHHHSRTAAYGLDGLRIPGRLPRPGRSHANPGRPPGAATGDCTGYRLNPYCRSGVPAANVRNADYFCIAQENRATSRLGRWVSRFDCGIRASDGVRYDLGETAKKPSYVFPSDGVMGRRDSWKNIDLQGNSGKSPRICESGPGLCFLG